MFARDMVEPINRMLNILRAYGDDARDVRMVFEQALQAAQHDEPADAYDLVSGAYGRCQCRDLTDVLPHLHAFCNCDFGSIRAA